MKNQYRQLWNKVSRIGLREDEGVLEFREVILLNQVLAVFPLIMLIYIPIEVSINGFSMLPLVFIMMGLFLLPLILHRYRWFKFAHYYLFFIANILILIIGLLVGKGIDNHVTLIPVVLMGIILFKTRSERIFVFLFTAGIAIFQQVGFELFKPKFEVSLAVRDELSFVFFLISMTICFLIGYYFIRVNAEYEKIVLEQKEEMVLKNREILDSITYAKRIQTAILPPERIVKEYLPDSFILYKPKDIVAGDFYWMEKVGDTVLFAAADCTGHGVPGAMVSVVCNNALSRSVREFQLIEPAKILDMARKIIIQEFEKSDEDVKDGMDISLCAFNFKTNELQWAGANNPLLIIRNREIFETKADKQPVGKHAGDEAFTNHVIQLLPKDHLYIFTDGYADQFGGPESFRGGKKFKYKAIKQLLLEAYDCSMEDQKNTLDTTIERWKGELEQVDDICIIGVKI